MILYSAAENSLEVEKFILDVLDDFKTPEEAMAQAEPGWKPFKIKIEVEALDG